MSHANRSIQRRFNRLPQSRSLNASARERSAGMLSLGGRLLSHNASNLSIV